MQTKKPLYRFLAKNGQLIWIRPLRANDTPVLVDIFEHMSSESRYHRFQQTVDHVPEQRIWREAEQIATADPQRNYGLLATYLDETDKEIPIGAVRWVAISENEAEVAISIRDDFQGLSIGTKMMQLLAEEAREHGFERLSANIDNDNPAILHVFARLPYEVLRVPDGHSSDIFIFLTQPRDPDQGHVDGLLAGFF
ncbi:MAG: GNAT family N-acetyltransferase [Anaerolineales bacterium]|nr:GNAT family N-acetyltransferase [Anaerolineales bacterium]